MATGTGKTDLAFHICWKLWSTRWNSAGKPRRPRMLFLSDRSILVDDPKDKQFAPFGDARWKIQGEAVKSREWFSILDYTGSATRLFADPDFDGDPIDPPTETSLDEPIPEPEVLLEGITYPEAADPSGEQPEASELPPRKLYVDGGSVEIAAHVVYELDSGGRKLRVVKYTDYASEKVRKLWTSAAELRTLWGNAQERAAIIEALEEHGITLEQLAENTGQPEADPFDLLCYVAFNAPLRTRRERAEGLRKGRVDFWERFKPESREILNDILDKYVEHGTAQFKIPDILKIPPISSHGNVLEIANQFGVVEQLRAAIENLQTLLYAEAA
jgi:type I restriction enzyme, R subunit